MKLYGVYATKALGITYFTTIEQAIPTAEQVCEERGMAYLALYGSERQFLSPEEFAKAMNGDKWWTHYELLTKYVKPGHGSKKVKNVKKSRSAKKILASGPKGRSKQAA